MASWEKLNGHKGIEFRQYGKDRSYRFRQHPYSADVLGVMEEATAIRISAELRENRSKEVGPQSFKEMNADNKEEAQKVAIVEKKERKRIIADEQFAQANTVGSFWDNVYWPKRKTEGSEHNNKSILGVFNNHIRPVVGNITLQEVTFSKIDEVFQAMYNKGLSAKTIDHAYTIFQAEWTYASIYLSAHNGIILPVFPGKMVKRPKLNNQKTCYLDPAEASKLLHTLYNWRDICKRHGINQKGTDTKDVYGMTVLSLLSGLRLGDIIKLTWRDVETAFAYARNPKGGRQYGIHLDIDMVRDMLEERRRMFPNARSDDPVFKDSTGKPWKEAPQAFEDVVEELCINYTPRRINNPLEKIDFHAMRHTFASWLAMAGTSLHTIMVLMGHESVAMTLRYARLNPAYTRQPVAEMATNFAKKHKELTDDEYIYVESSPMHEMKKEIFMFDS
ncbi:tyrosine-type recombinase/integrase [Desulfovibrio litoralis]|uniref:Site-specific recombinase XerD n=1 Tax=Desulfovibrio litoralis DSM 11393 TaxID=1121455 RepID=A0A1M7TNS2_9BACT|nr:tyrosine-type recombinase/integrase [Desulfovibrio litoralis]SHN72355.1 Site-specific recombinase XerD [Desulfovibrio litoralis DSM 11393]